MSASFSVQKFWQMVAALFSAVAADGSDHVRGNLNHNQEGPLSTACMDWLTSLREARNGLSLGDKRYMSSMVFQEHRQECFEQHGTLTPVMCEFGGCRNGRHVKGWANVETLRQTCMKQEFRSKNHKNRDHYIQEFASNMQKCSGLSTSTTTPVATAVTTNAAIPANIATTTMTVALAYCESWVFLCGDGSHAKVEKAGASARDVYRCGAKITVVECKEGSWKPVESDEFEISASRKMFCACAAWIAGIALAM